MMMLLLCTSPLHGKIHVVHAEQDNIEKDISRKTVEEYLTRFGYLPHSNMQNEKIDITDQMKDAMKKLQWFAGLNITGKIDKKTVELINRKRCGTEDLSGGGINTMSPQVKAIEKKWTRNNLTWSIRKPPQPGKISRDVVRRELSLALSVWAQYILLDFTETNQDDSSADIQVFFHRQDHGDRYPFDGRGSVLAHAFLPGAGMGGDAHFDEDENWSDVREISREVTSLFSVAVHEFGHSLGLSHNNNTNSLMFPWYSSVPQDMTLPQEDQQAIQNLYGVNHQPSSTIPYLKPTTPQPIQTTPQPINTTPRPIQTTPQPILTTTTVRTRGAPQPTLSTPSMVDKCDTDLDAITMFRGEMWAFKGRYCWRLGGEGIYRDEPIELRQFWYSLPSSTDHVDAVYENKDHDIVFFIGIQYYILDGNNHIKYGPLPLTVSQNI